MRGENKKGSYTLLIIRICFEAYKLFRLYYLLKKNSDTNKYKQKFQDKFKFGPLCAISTSINIFFI